MELSVGETQNYSLFPSVQCFLFPGAWRLVFGRASLKASHVAWIPHLPGFLIFSAFLWPHQGFQSTLPTWRLLGSYRCPNTPKLLLSIPTKAWGVVPQLKMKLGLPFHQSLVLQCPSKVPQCFVFAKTLWSGDLGPFGEFWECCRLETLAWPLRL